MCLVGHVSDRFMSVSSILGQSKNVHHVQQASQSLVYLYKSKCPDHFSIIIPPLNWGVFLLIKIAQGMHIFTYELMNRSPCSNFQSSVFFQAQSSVSFFGPVWAISRLSDSCTSFVPPEDYIIPHYHEGVLNTLPLQSQNGQDTGTFNSYTHTLNSLIGADINSIIKNTKILRCHPSLTV